MPKDSTCYATGRRKSAIARAWLKPGNGAITINNHPADEYFKLQEAVAILTQPLALTNNREAFDVMVRVQGGGVLGQATAIRHGITRALLVFDPELRPALKKAGFVTRDARAKERKKYGQRSARARFQFSKR